MKDEGLGMRGSAVRLLTGLPVYFIGVHLRLSATDSSWFSPTLAFVLLCSIGVPAGAWAADARNYPDRPVRLIDPYAPGGGSGLVARLVGAKLGEAGLVSPSRFHQQHYPRRSACRRIGSSARCRRSL